LVHHVGERPDARARGRAGAPLRAGCPAVPARLSAPGTRPLARGQLLRAGALTRHRPATLRGRNQPMRARAGRVADVVGARVAVAGARLAGRRRRSGHTRAAGADVADGTHVAVLARARVEPVHARAGRVADLVGAFVPVVWARGARRVQPAARRAAVAVGVVAVLAVFQGVDHAVAAPRARGEARATCTRVGAVGLLAIARAADDHIGAEPSDLPGEGICARVEIHRTVQADRVRSRRARADPGHL